MSELQKSIASAPSGGLENVAVLIVLTIGRFGTSKVDRAKSADVADDENAERGRVKVSKQLLAPSFTAQIDKLTRSTRDWLAANTAGYSIPGARLLPLTLLGSVQDGLAARSAEFYAAVEAARRELTSGVEAARRELGGLFRDEDYPDPDGWAACYHFGWTLREIQQGPVNELFRAAMGARLSDFEEALRAEHDAVLRRAQADLVGRVRVAVGNLVDKCSKPSNETKLLPSLVDNVRELIELVPHLNLTGDAGIDAVAVELRDQLAGLSLETLRLFPSERAAAVEGGQKVISALDAWGL